MSRIKRYFVTGLLITLPVLITVYLVFIIFVFIDGIWGKPINFYLKKYLGFGVPGLGFILLILTAFIVGFIATNFFGRRIFYAIEKWFLKLPLVRQIYPPAKQVVDSFISSNKPAFKKVVLVEYPSKGIWSVGFLTNDGLKEAEEKTGEKLVHVFIATTPTPFSGFLILVPRNQVKVLNMSIEEGFKLIVSGGIFTP
ncbi:MAG: DUF502 domain-containing protein [Candidatus Omnitrophica bacterium]|nr:DUF502 domain-containing protein [Candidatus Omnitrophota bacterium]